MDFKIPKLSRRAADANRDGLPSTQELLEDPKSTYLRELTSSNNPEVDLVAVHGLNFVNKSNFGVRTWTAGAKGEEKLWLKDFLPHRLPNVRVLLYGYNSNVAFSTSMMGVGDIAEDLLHKLWTMRQDAPERPLLFVCHSLGGLVVKRAVVKARSIPRYQAISRSAKSFVFFATPHRGGFGAGLGHATAGLVRRLGGNPRTGIMEALRKDSHVAPDLNNDFVDAQDDYHICSFYECKPLHPPGPLIVEKSSAVLGLGSSEVRVPCPNADHSSICKFAIEDEDYGFVIDEIETLVVWAVKSTGNNSVHSRKSSTCSSSSESFSSPEIQINAGSYFDEDDQVILENAIRLPKDLPEVNRLARRGPFFLVPYERNPQFVGRQDILHRLQTFSDPSNSVTSFALCGLGGVGKTQTALAHAYWHWVNYPEHSVFWILASDGNQLSESLGLIGAHCRISRVQDTTDIMLDRVRRWLSDENNGRWLMIIDGANTIDTWSNSPDDDQRGRTQAVKSFPSASLAQYVPTCSHGKVLIAANNRSIAESLVHPRHVLEVQPLDTHYACTLLRKHLTEVDGTSDSDESRHEPLRQDDLVKLASELDYLPLALVQAAAYIRTHSWSVKYFLQLITLDQSNLPSVSKTDLQARDELDELSPACKSSWKVAFDQVEAHCTPAADLLSIIAFYERERIPKSLFSHFHTSTSKTSTLVFDTLLAYSFITMDSQSETFSIHRLIQLAMRKRLSAHNTEKKWAVEALMLISGKFPDGEHESWPICAILLPHSLKLLRSELYGPDEARPLGILESKISQYYLRRGLFQQAEIWSRKALDNIILVPGMDLKEVSDIKSDRIIVLLKLGAFDEAEDLAQEVWRGRKTTSGAKYEDTLQIVATLALVYQQQGRYEKGEIAVRKVLKSLDRTLEADDMQVLTVKQRLSIILRHLGRYKEAEEHQLAAIRGFSKNLGPRHPNTLKAHWILGELYHAWGLYPEAERIAMDTWTLQKRDDILGPDHPDTLISLHSLANNFQALFKFSAAESHKREIYRKATILVGPTHIYTLIAGSSLASCLVASNMYANQPSAERLAEAEDLYRHTLTTREANLRPGHPNTLAARTDLTVVQRLRGQTNAGELEASERETLNMLKRTLGKNHPLTVNSRDNLSRILWLQRDDNIKRKEALKKAMEVFTFWEQNSGWSHERTWLAAELLVEILPESDERVPDLTQKIRRWRRSQPTVDQ